VWSLRVATVVTAGSCLATAAGGRSLLTLLIPIAVAGAANALCQPAANLLIARAVPAARQGFAFAIKQSAIPFSTLLAGVAVPALALTVGWRWAFVAAAGLAALAGAGVPDVGLAGSTTDPTDRAGAGREARQARKARTARPPTDVPLPVMATLAVGIGFGAAAGGTLGSFMVSAAVDGGLSEGAAGWLLTAGSIAGITVRLLAGVQADRRDGGHLRVVALMLLLGAGAFGILAIGSEWTYLLAGPAGFMTAWAWPGLFNLAVVLANPASPAAATGITQTGTYVGAVSGPLLFGVIAEAWSYRVAWLVAAGFAVCASVGMLSARGALRRWRAGLTPSGSAPASTRP
jgi:MFS family permease